MHGWILRAFGLLAIVCGVYGWIDFVWPPVDKFLDQSDKLTFSQIVGELINPWSRAVYDDQPAAGLLFLAAIVLLSFVLLLLLSLAMQAVLHYIANARVPLSVLSLRLKLEFKDKHLVQSRISRTQIIHANRRVQAYKSSIKVNNKNATIDWKSYQSTISSKTKNYQVRPINVGTETNREIVDVFDTPLHTNFLVTDLPNFIVFWMRGCSRKTIVKRRTSIDQFNEYNGEDPCLMLSSIRYPINNVRFSLIFPEAVAPDKNEIECFLVKDNTAIPFQATVDPNCAMGTKCYWVERPSVKNATIMVLWKNTKLKAYLAGGGQP